ncbi:MAG: LysR family transcriptional regulator [Desulfobacterales bacterium]|nr:LysR family transcriptional regulator [Desulfobacterales bacterium]
MIDELKALAVFSETVKQKSFRGAAKQLNLSPSVVSYHITQLEKRIGTPLLYRSTRKISLTHHGSILYGYTTDMLDAAREGLGKISSASPEPFGRLSIRLPSVLTRSPVNRKIAEFSSRHPGIEFHFSYSDVRQDLISNGIDLAIRVGHLEDSALKSKRIGTIERKLVCSPDYLLKYGTPQHPGDLSDWEWIRLEMLPGTRRLRKGGKTFEVKYRSHVFVDNVEAMTQFCIYGLGVATPPDYLVTESIKENNLVELIPEWKVDALDLFAVWPANASSNSNIRLLLNHLTST